MFTLFCILLYLWGCSQESSAYEYEQTEYENERRHRELMEQNEELASTKPVKKKITRNIARDEKGRFIAQEIVEDL